MADEHFTGGFEANEKIEVCGLEACTRIFTTKAEIFNIAFFEFFGMVLFSYVVIAYGGIIDYPGAIIVEVGMFFALVISGSYGCGYLNPALILSCVIRKENRISIPLGLYYWAIQYAAAFVGTFIAWSYDNNLTAPFPLVHAINEQVWETFGKEALGSFVFLFCVLIMITSETTFTQNNFQTWFCVPLCLIAVCKIFNLALGTNPAQALAFQLAYYLLNTTEPQITKHIELQAIWSVIVGATIGGLIAVVVFEFVYRPYVKVFKNESVSSNFVRDIKVALISTPTNIENLRRVTNIEMA